MLPETYDTKNESMMNICKSCDWLCSTFRLALLGGHHDQAVTAYATGNVNLVTPFANVSGEILQVFAASQWLVPSSLSDSLITLFILATRCIVLF
jgi:hypothetical protein